MKSVAAPRIQQTSQRAVANTTNSVPKARSSLQEAADASPKVAQLQHFNQMANAPDNPPIQRWSVALINAERSRLAATDAAEEVGGEIALHHIVSRDELTKIQTEVAKLGGMQTRQQKKDWAETIPAAKEFLSSIRQAAAISFGDEVDEFRSQTNNSLEKMLHNLPANLVAGPAQLLGDAGTDLDPATVSSDASTDTMDVRVNDARSVELDKLVTAYGTLIEACAEKKDANAAAALKTMSAALIAAVEAHVAAVDNVGTVAGVDPAQWVQHGDRWTKKTEGTYHDVASGAALFTTAQENPAAFPNADIEFETPDDADTYFCVSLTAGQIAHIFQRHSYWHFDFDAEPKLRNTFWRPNISVAQINTILTDAAQSIYDTILPMITAGNLPEDGPVNVSLPGYFHIANFVADGMGGGFVEIKTIAPEGATGDTYSKADLALIKAAL